MSTVAAGVFLGRYGRTKISPGVHEFMHHFWETMAFAANSILFLSIGLLLPQVFQASSFATYLWPLVIAVIAINIARAFSTFTLIPTLHMTRFVEKISRAYQVVMWWGGGLRGAIAVALALTLAGSQLTSQDQAGIIFLTFGVVLFTLVANALSIQPIIRLLGLDRLQATEVFSRELASLHAKRVASETLQKTEHFVDTRPEVKRRVLDEYLLELEELRRRVSDLSGLNAEEKKEVLAGEALLLEKHVYFDLFALGHISDLAFQDLEYEINLELDRLKGKQELFVSRRQFEEPAWYDRLFKPLARLIPSRTTKELVLRYEKGGATI
ncbi:MAG: cation:proton antiporter, partial [Bacteroidota bacterium]